MKTFKIIFLFLIVFLTGCSGTGFEKQTTLVPDSLSISYGTEKYHGDPEAWRGFTISTTWVFK